MVLSFCKNAKCQTLAAKLAGDDQQIWLADLKSKTQGFYVGLPSCIQSQPMASLQPHLLQNCKQAKKVQHIVDMVNILNCTAMQVDNS